MSSLGLGFRVLGFRVVEFRVLGFRALGIQGFRVLRVLRALELGFGA